jgi:ribulose-5-phosphate 4-epimerase/fuculose-1-phosphate aldolase
VYRDDHDGHRERLVSYCSRLLDDGLAIGTAGSMSVRTGDQVLITPSGIPSPRRRRRCTWPGTPRRGPARAAGYTRFGSGGLARAATAALDGRRAAILRNHGAISYGACLGEARQREDRP